jgi:hypothetical protein
MSVEVVVLLRLPIYTGRSAVGGVRGRSNLRRRRSDGIRDGGVGGVKSQDIVGGALGDEFEITRLDRPERYSPRMPLM